MVLSLPYKIWTYLYVIVFSFNFLDKIISIIWHSVCGCLCQWSGWLSDNGELNPVFYIQPAICIFLPVCWTHTLKSLLRTLFQFSEFSLCYPYSWLPSVDTMDSVITLLSSNSFQELRSFPCSPDWDFLLSSLISVLS